MTPTERPHRGSFRRFPLTRYFVILSFITILGITALSSAISFHEIRKEMLEEAKGHAVDVIRDLQQDVARYFIEPVLAEGRGIDLQEPDQLARLDSVVRPTMESFHILNLYLLDPDGLILYSTNHDHIGFTTAPDNDLFQRAARGEIASALRERGSPLDLREEGAGVSLLETYVPVASLADKDAGPGTVANIIETYQDLDRYQRKMDVARRRHTLFAFLGATLMFLVLFWIIRRADSIIRERSQDLVATNEQLRTLSQHLEEEVQLRSRQLVQKEKLASLGTLSSGLAHEINNPIATIASCAQGLRRRIETFKKSGALEAEDFDSYLELIAGEAFRVKGITTSLLDFSRQQMSGESALVDPLQVAREAVELLREGDRLQEIEVSIEESLEPLRVRANPTTLRQVFLNLTGNAADAIRDLRRSGAVAGTIRWTGRLNGGRVELICADDGAGFEPERASDLLAPFFTTKPPGEGTGLGLALCHSVMQRHGGAIEISSEGPGRGARVRLVFPPPEGEDHS